MIFVFSLQSGGRLDLLGLGVGSHETVAVPEVYLFGDKGRGGG